MQVTDPSILSQQQGWSKEQQSDIYSLPLPIRIKHPSWSARKGTYQQLLYYLKTIASPNQQILISGASYTVQTLLPYFENLIQEKHAGVLLKGLQCVEQILILDKKAHSRHCIKTLADKGIQFFPLSTQSRKAILEKFLDILQLSKIESSFLKNKLNLPHEKSVMYVIEVIGVLNMVSLKGVLVNLSKKHQKKCVRQLAAEIADELQDNKGETDTKQKPSQNSSNPSNPSTTKSKPSQNPTCKYTIQKLPHYQQLASKKQQQFSTELSQKIESIIEEYSFAQLPNFSHILRLMMDDNNHIINVNAIKCLIAIFEREKEEGKGSLVPVSFPLLFVFSKFKSHKTHPINFLMLSLVEALLKSSSNRVNDLFLAISQGLSSAGSKANVKFGCALSFFRAISLIYKNEDLYNCTINENIENENQDIREKFSKFDGIRLGKNMMKVMEKITGCLEKDKKYETEMYLIKFAIGLDSENLGNEKGISHRDLMVVNNKSPKYGQHSQTKNKTIQMSRQNKGETINNRTEKNPSKRGESSTTQSSTFKPLSGNLSITKTTKKPKHSQKYEEINLEQTLTKIIKLVNSQGHQNQLKKGVSTQLQQLLQKSSQQFYQSVRQRRFQMFYLCQLLENFIETYQPNDLTIETVSEYLINLLKIISLLKSCNPSTAQQFHQITLNNVSQILLVALCKLVINQEIHQVLENIHQNYGYEIVFEALELLVVKKTTNKIKKKNRKYLLQWLQGNTPALFLNQHYYLLVDAINEKETKKGAKTTNNTQQKSSNNSKESPLNNKQSTLDNNESPLDNQTRKNTTSKHPLTSQNRQHLPTPSSPKKPSNKHFFTEQFSSGKKQQFNLNELQNINLSKIEKNLTQNNQYDEEMEKSSFHQNLQEHLRQIRTHRSFQEEMGNSERATISNRDINFEKNHDDMSREYLNQMVKIDKNQQSSAINQFRKKVNFVEDEYEDKQIINLVEDDYEDKQIIKHANILESSPFKYNSLERYREDFQSLSNKKSESLSSEKDQNYQQKFKQVERRRIQREKERKEFMNKMKHEFKPIISHNRHQEDDLESEEESEEQKNHQNINQYNNNKHEKEFSLKERSRLRQYPHDDQNDQENNHYNPKHSPNDSFLRQQEKLSMQKQPFDPSSFTKLLPQKSNLPQNQDSQKPDPSAKNNQIVYQQAPKQSVDCSFVSSTQSGEFKYRELNQEKLTYMLKSTSNPYQHLRNLILIPFKSSHKKHQFLKELLHFFTNHVEFKIPQPYTSLILLTILMFSEIKQDKTLIQPLQSLYEFLAKQSTTNDFIKTIVNLFHTVIEQTLPQNRKFLITILLKSMIRMLPFIQDGLSLLRDIQQFYQIGEMFQMFEEEYTQIKTYMDEEAVHIVVEKAFQQEGHNLIAIVEGWLVTSWKNKVLQTIQELQAENQDLHQHEQEEHHYQNYQSYI